MVDGALLGWCTGWLLFAGATFWHVPLHLADETLPLHVLPWLHAGFGVLGAVAWPALSWWRARRRGALRAPAWGAGAPLRLGLLSLGLPVACLAFWRWVLPA